MVEIFLMVRDTSIQGCHLAFLKAKSAKFGLFLNCLPEIKWFGHLAIFWPFFNVDKNSIS